MASTPAPRSPRPAGRGGLTRSQTRLTPLWVIGAFLSLTEVVITIGVIKTEGSVALILTFFSTVFLFFVSACFFYILISRPQVFYARTDLHPGVDFPEFVQALNFVRHQASTRGKALADVERGLEGTLTAGNHLDRIMEVIDKNVGNLIDDRRPALKQEISLIIKDVNERAVRKSLDETGLFVDTRPLLGERIGEELYFAFSTFSKVQDFLNLIWAIVNNDDPGIEPWTYNSTWVLQDSSSGRTFLNIGSLQYPTSERASHPDERGLTDVGILPGMHLLVRKPPVQDAYNMVRKS
jgi:hypothetical protein